MRSGILIGTCAWLLGAAAATAGSLYAVNDLGQGLVAQHSKQVTVAMVNAELALERSAHSSPTTAAPSPSASPSAQPSSTAASPSPSAPPDPGELLISKDGTVVAVCKPAGAYLSSWSPLPGFAAAHVVRGPARVAKVAFIGSAGGLMIGVTCDSGQPAEHIWPLRWHYRPDH